MKMPRPANKASLQALFASIFGLAAFCGVRAESVEVTDQLEYLFAPMESRYGTSTNYLSSRAVHCMAYLKGRIYIGGGDWNDNTGPVPIISILPGEKPTWTNEYSAGAEHIEAFKTFSDGRIWTRSTDPREGDANYGYFFAKFPSGAWKRCPLGMIDWNPAHTIIGGSAALYTHEWDFCDYQGSFYFTGFGVGGSDYWLKGDETFANKMYSVTSGQTNGYYNYTRITAESTSNRGVVSYTTEAGVNLERFMTLMPFDNGCIAVPAHWYESRKPSLNQCYYWGRNASSGKFERIDCDWSAFLDGHQAVDWELAGPNYGWWMYLRRATPFKGRVYYIVTPGISMNAPIGFFSATMDAEGAVSSKRHAFENGKAHVIDIAVVGGAMYVMSVRYDAADSIAHGIWKTTDGENFSQIAAFTTDQYVESFTYAKGCFYLGYGYAKLGSVGFSAATPETDKAGQIWRFSLPQDDDDGSDDGLDLSNAPWYWQELNVVEMFERGITGKGVKVGVVDAGCQNIVEDGTIHMSIDHHGGNTSASAAHGIQVCSVVKSDRFGIAPDAELYAYNGTGFVDDIKGIWWCFTNGCRVINFSGGYTPFDYTDDELAWGREQIRALLDKGAILIASGGNAPNETLTFPQDMDGVINIAGLKRDRTSANLNDNWAKDFAAFGSDVPLYTGSSGAVGTNSGTSFAAPMVSAICALYLQQNPDLTRDELYAILKSTAAKLEEARSRVSGWGLVQAAVIPSDYKRQAEIDAEKATWVKAEKLVLDLVGPVWNESSLWHEIKVYPGQSVTLKCHLEPATATDTNIYWYCGNTTDFNRIGSDNVLTIPSTTAVGRFLVYECRNLERESIGKVKVIVVSQGEETQLDETSSGDDSGDDSGGGSGGDSGDDSGDDSGGGSGGDSGDDSGDDSGGGSSGDSGSGSETPQNPETPAASTTNTVSSSAKAYIWNRDVTSGSIDSAECYLVGGSVPAAAPGADDEVVIDSLGVKLDVRLNGAFACKSLTLSNRAAVYGYASIAADTLVAGVGYSKLRCSSAEFGKFESAGFIGTIGVLSGKVRFADTSSLKQIGGVLPEFALAQDSDQSAANALYYTPYGICRLDENGYVVEYPTSEMHQGLLDAGQDDTVYVGEKTTLTEDVTINALHNASTIDLNGYTLTVKSGVIRNSKWGCGTITNGTLRSSEPIMYVDGVNNSNKRWFCKIVVDGDVDFNNPVLGAVSCGAVPDMSGNDELIGRIVGLSSCTFNATFNSQTAFWDFAANASIAYIADHWESCAVRALGGSGSVQPYGFGTKFYVGIQSESEAWNNMEFIVGNQGLLAVGSILYDGSRLGNLTFADPNSNIKGYQKLIFRSGGTLEVTVRSDGSATCLKTTGTSSYRTKISIEGGALVLREADRIRSGSWTVVNSIDPVEGEFSSVTDGYKLCYNQLQDDGTYSTIVTKRLRALYVSLR
ncbi:MAG: S8 family peptidase [Kiritimatiellia bacterium]